MGLEWILVLDIYAGAVKIPMQNKAACEKAMASTNDKDLYIHRFCINASTGQVIKE